MTDEIMQAHFRDQLEQISRLAGAAEVQGERISELASVVRRMPCERHMAILDEMDRRGTTANQGLGARMVEVERQMAAVSTGSGNPKTDPGNKAVTQHDLDRWAEDSEVRAMSAAEKAASRTVVERLEELEAQREKMASALERDRYKIVEERRGSIRFGVEMLKVVLPLIAGAGIVFAARCEVARPAHMQHARDAGSRIGTR